MIRLLTFVLGIETDFRGQSLVRDFEKHGIQVHIIYGFDGRHHQPPESWINNQRSRRLYNRSLRNSEIACTEGHWRILQTAMQYNFEYLLVLEDDVRCDSLSEFLDWFARLENTGEEMYLFRHRDYRSELENIYWRKNGLGIGIPNGTYVYLLHADSVRKLLSLYKQYSFSGYVADFPNFYADVLKFRLGPVGVFSLRKVESFVGAKEQSTSGSKFLLRVAHGIYEFSFAKYVFKVRRDSGIRAYIQFVFGKRVALLLKLVYGWRIKLTKFCLNLFSRVR